MARGQQESNFINELHSSILNYYPDAAFWKIPDMPTKRQHKKLFDIVAGFGGLHFTIEAKCHYSENSWPLDRVKDHQAEWLEKFNNNLFISLIMIEVKTKKNHYVKLMPIKGYLFCLSLGFKSIKHDLLFDEGKNIIYKKDDLWNIPGMILNCKGFIK